MVDSCQSCGADDLGMPMLFLSFFRRRLLIDVQDLSPHFFQNLGGSNAGTLSISWNFD